MSTMLQMLQTSIEYVTNIKLFSNVIVTSESKLDDVVESVIHAIKKLGFSDQEMQEYALMYFVSAKWAIYKTVYRFDPDFYSILIDTENNITFHQDSLKHIPVQYFFIPDPSGKDCGSFITVDFDGSDTVVACRKVQYNSDHETASGYVSIILHDGDNIQEVIQKNLKKFRERNTATLTLSDEDLLNYAHNVLIPPIQIAYYLSAKNAEVREVKTKKSKRPKLKDGRPLNLRQWDVGYRIGNQFREVHPHSQSSGTGTRPRPHIRRAHWHHFWCGPNKSELELKWLAPMFINTTENSNDVVSTEHEVII